MISVECDKDPLEFPYIKSAKFNGAELDRPYLTYGEITSGGTLLLELSKDLCPDFGKNTPTRFWNNI